MVDVLDLFVFTASGTRRTTQNPGTSSIRPTSTRWFIPTQTQESCKSLLIPNPSAREKMAPRHRVTENLTAVTSLEKQDRTGRPSQSDVRSTWPHPRISVHLTKHRQKARASFPNKSMQRALDTSFLFLVDNNLTFPSNKATGILIKTWSMLTQNGAEKQLSDESQ